MTTRIKSYYNVTFTSSFEATEDGGLVVHNVPLMAVGKWTSMQNIVTAFTAEVLQRCATAWSDYGIWLRHPGGAPRDAHEKVGAVKNPHYDPSANAVVGDLYLHQRTENSRAAGQLVQLSKADGGIKSVSAETMVTVGENNIVTDIVFTGLALVDDGACETCRIPAYSAGEDTEMAEELKKEEEIKKEEPVKTEAADPAKTPKEIPESAEPSIIQALTEALETVVPGIKEIVDNIIASSGDEVAKAKGFGRLEQALMACGGKKTYSKPEDLAAAFEKYKTDTDAKIAAIQTAYASKAMDGKTEMGANPKKVEPVQVSESNIPISLNNFQPNKMRL